MRCKKCGAYNEDYLEYCENCAAPLTPDDETDTAPSAGNDAAANEQQSYVAETGETPPAWGFVKAPQWPRPEFDANTVSEDDIPENYFKKFNPRPAAPVTNQAPQYAKPEAVITDSGVYAPKTAAAPVQPAYAYQQPRQTSRDARYAGSAPYAEQTVDASGYAPVASEAPVAPKKRASKAAPVPAKEEEEDFYDYDDRTHRSASGKRNIIFIAAAAGLVVLIVVFGLIFIGAKYDGNFSKFISCTFAGDPVTKAPTVETSTTKDGDPAYLITVYAKNNYIVRFTAGELVAESAVVKGSVTLRIPEEVWIPAEPLDSATISVTPDIVVVNPNKGDETKVEFTEPIVISVPTIGLTMTEPTVSDVTVDSTTVAVSGVVDDNTASIFVGDTQVAVDEAGNFTTNYTLPGEGTYVLEVKAQKNGCMSAVATYNITYGAASDPTTAPSTGGNVTFAINDDVKRYGTDATMTVSGTMESGATITVSGVELEGAVTMDQSAGTFSFTVKTADIGLYEASVTATKGEAAKTTKVYLEHQPDKNTYMSHVFALDYDRIKNYPTHESSYKVVGTIAEVIQSTPYVIARITTSAGDIYLCYFTGISTIEVGDGKTYELYADPYGLYESTGLPYMHAWFILKGSN